VIFSWVSWAAIYFIVWWMTLFTVLPFEVRNQTDGGEVVPGADSGAPASVRVGRVALITTAVATVIFLGVVFVLTQTYFRIDDVPLLPKYVAP
jgi:predicted secreted protein